MKLTKPRSYDPKSNSTLFEYPDVSYEVFRPLQDEIWAAIRLLSTKALSISTMRKRQPTRTRAVQSRHASMLRSCISQAEDLFWLAEEAASNTAPILYYYSMLNLAKALIYIEQPVTLTSGKGLFHGLGDPNRIKNPVSFSLDNENVRVNRGVFPTLYHLLSGSTIPLGTDLNIRILLRYCTWIGSEVVEATGDSLKLVNCDLQSRISVGRDATWATVFIAKPELSLTCKSVSDFLRRCKVFAKQFRRVESEREGWLQFEGPKVACPPSVAGLRRSRRELEASLSSLRLFRPMKYSDPLDYGEYLIPLDDTNLPTLPEPCVLLAMAFYLSSIARYQPHVYETLEGTPDAWILEAFLRQCPVVFAALMLNHLRRREHIFVS